MLPMSQIKAFALLAAVAVAGFGAGAATMSRAETKPPVDLRERCSYTGMLQERLGLSETQRDSIRAIMRSHRPDMRALMSPIQPQMDSLRHQMREEIRAVLTDTQRERYDSMATRERTERARFDSTNARRGGER